MEKAWEGEGQEPCGRGLSGANRPRATASTGRLLLLWLRPATLVTTRGTHLPRSHKCQAGEPSLQGGGEHGAAAGTGGGAIGEACEEYSECQSGGCVTNSLSSQKFCSPQAVFQQCLSWQKPNRHTCLDHTECWSGCCVTSSYGLQTYCTAKTIFLQCVPWCKPNGDYCTDHGECRSKCCVQPNEVDPHRCVPRSGVLVQCLPWVSPGTGSSPPVGLTPATGLRAGGRAGNDLEVVCPLPGEAANCLCRSASVPVS
ncbi:leucine-rich colipase-like protein 1 [Tursiops truncatus]|uniref:leucine-rich colipase-like protein 1 n=1 Tax=Tursiops truncatus TaxID=9739 RepID=UPI003CCF356B